MDHVKLNTINLREKCSEIWLADAIAADPSILGLGDLLVKDRERIQPGAGRLDLLLQEPDGYGRYEVELQLGASDPSHIIRTIEYWDRERKRYPQYDHTAVLVAEDITSRFLNVVSLFNGCIPIIAIQVTGIELSSGLGLHFTKILDTIDLGTEEEEDSEPADRSYWENQRGTPATVKLADRLFEIANEVAPGTQPSYTQPYVGCRIDGKAKNFMTCCPQRSALRVSVYLPQTEDLGKKAETIDGFLQYDHKAYHFKFKDLAALNAAKPNLVEVLKQAYDWRK